MLNVYGIANCDSVSAARRWLKEHGIAHEFHDLRKEHVDAQTLEQWLAALGRERLVNKSSATWRTLERSQREQPVVALQPQAPALPTSRDGYRDDSGHSRSRHGSGHGGGKHESFLKRLFD